MYNFKKRFIALTLASVTAVTQVTPTLASGLTELYLQMLAQK